MERSKQSNTAASIKMDPLSANTIKIAQPPTGKAWFIVALLTAFMAVNFADKAILGLSAVPIMRDLGLSHAQFGKLGSAFFLFFCLSAVVGGFLANRIRAKVLLGAMALIWAVLQLPMIGTVTVTTLVVCRTLLGASEGPAYPISLHAVYKWFRNEHRTFPASVLAIGSLIGSGIAAPLLTWIIFHYSWHVAFGVVGCIGLIWVAAWSIFGEEGPESVEAKAQSKDETGRLPYTTLIFSRTVIGAIIASFSAYWALSLFIVWLPAFLVKGAGYSPLEAGWIVMVPSSFQVGASIAIGYLSQRMLVWGFSTRVARGVLGGGLVALGGTCVIALSLTNKGPLEILFVLGSFSMSNLMFNLGGAAIGEIIPPAQRGAVLGINQAIFSTSGIAAPWVMGHMVDVGRTVAVGFRSGFTLAGCLILCGGLMGMLLINLAKDLERFSRRASAPDFQLGSTAQING